MTQLLDDDRRRFLYHTQADPKFRFYLMNPDWFRVVSSTQICEPLVGGAKAGLVTYPSGEILCAFGFYRHVPDGTHFMEGPNFRDGSPGYQSRLVRNGVGGVKVTHGESLSQSADPRYYYATSVKNMSQSKLRVMKFAPFSGSLFGIRTQPREGYYSPLQFREWFRVPDPDGWISPGEEVHDPDNYGSGGGVWAYFLEDENGGRLIATAPLQRAIS